MLNQPARPVFFRLLCLIGLITLAYNVVASTKTLKPIVTRHQILINQKPFSYEVTVGRCPIKNKKGQPIGTMSYMAYTQTDPHHTRPLTFMTNGGPGLPSFIFNFLNAGPKIIDINHKQTGKGKLIDNPHTWLSFTDEVYIDEIGTGFGQLKKEQYGSDVYNTSGDADAFAQCIAYYLNQNERTDAPLYFAGESYAGFRMTLTVNHLQQHDNILFKGIIYISPLLDFKTVVASYANNLANVVFLPTYTYLALYHHKLPATSDVKPEDVEKWAIETYMHDLFEGDKLRMDEREALAEKLSTLIGLPAKDILKQHNRVSPSFFKKALLKKENQVLDMLDGRYTHPKGHKYGAGNDALLDYYNKVVKQNIMPHLKNDLKIPNSNHLVIYKDVQSYWDWAITKGNPAAPEVLSILHHYLGTHEDMHLFFGLGYYDIDIPYFGSERNIDQLLLSPKQQQRITKKRYPAGHVIYWDLPSKAKLYDDVKHFYEQSP